MPSTTLPTAVTSAASSLKLMIRRSADRGHADHSWLKTYHTFSFADYQDSQFNDFGSLRVINEDVVQPSKGFGQHSHANFEIFSYIIKGEIEHRDSLANVEILKSGQVQMTSAGTGISHSEFNRNPDSSLHFLQIWVTPTLNALKPQYFNRYFSPEEKTDKMVKIVGTAGAIGVAPDRNASGPAPIHAPLSAYASILTPSASLTHVLEARSTKAYLHLIMSSGYRPPTIPASEKFENGGAKIRVNGVVLQEGDGVFVSVGAKKAGTVTGAAEEKWLKIENVGEREAEFVLFEMES